MTTTKRNKNLSNSSPPKPIQAVINFLVSFSLFFFPAALAQAQITYVTCPSGDPAPGYSQTQQTVAYGVGLDYMVSGGPCGVPVTVTLPVGAVPVTAFAYVEYDITGTSGAPNFNTINFNSAGTPAAIEQGSPVTWTTFSNIWYDMQYDLNAAWFTGGGAGGTVSTYTIGTSETGTCIGQSLLVLYTDPSETSVNAVAIGSGNNAWHIEEDNVIDPGNGYAPPDADLNWSCLGLTCSTSNTKMSVIGGRTDCNDSSPVGDEDWIVPYGSGPGPATNMTGGSDNGSPAIFASPPGVLNCGGNNIIGDHDRTYNLGANFNSGATSIEWGLYLNNQNQKASFYQQALVAQYECNPVSQCSVTTLFNQTYNSPPPGWQVGIAPYDEPTWAEGGGSISFTGGDGEMNFLLNNQVASAPGTIQVSMCQPTDCCTYGGIVLAMNPSTGNGYGLQFFNNGAANPGTVYFDSYSAGVTTLVSSVTTTAGALNGCPFWVEVDINSSCQYGVKTATTQAGLSTAAVLATFTGSGCNGGYMGLSQYNKHFATFQSFQFTGTCAVPTPTNTSTSTVVNTATATATTTPTVTPTNTPTNTNTNTVTDTPTNTATTTPTDTPTNTSTNTNTNTVTNTDTNTPTNTNTNTATNTPTTTATNTPTNTATNTVPNTPTNTPTATDTNTPTNTATNTIVDTPTNTATNTNTNTATNTIVNTPTNTPTATDTNTPTNTIVDTLTNTPTATDTNTPTNTSTDTVIDTPTNTATNTNTNTVTDTIVDTLTNTPTTTDTNTPTNTATDTPIDTDTNTPTSTSTNTATATAVNTFTYTNTATGTSTSTSTDTPVNTSTFTNTDTATPTSTSTNTPTSTDSQTVTNTFTPTWTPTSTETSTPSPTAVGNVTMGKTVSETTANAGDLVTYSIGVTVTGSSAVNVVVTDTLAADLAFVSYGSTAPAGTIESPDPPPLKWTLPSPLAVGIYQLSYQTRVNSFVSGETITNNAQLSYTGLSAPLTASVNVRVTGIYTININIYNSAGEVVKTIQVKQYSQPINNITLSASNQITSLQGPGSTISIFYDGILISTWDGSNNSGNPVTNGNYTIKVDSVSPTGVVTSVQQDATVNRELSNITANIYNSAGELVRTLYYMVSDATTSQMTDVSLSTAVMNLGQSNSTGKTDLQIFVNTTGTPVTLTWDGTNNAATNVTPGTYEIELHWYNGTGETTNITRSVVVTGGGLSGVVVAEPNVLEPGQTMTTMFTGTGIAGAWTLNAKVYTIAGELVKSMTGSPGTATAFWNASGMASGVYIAGVQVQDVNGGILENQRLKVLVLH